MLIRGENASAVKGHYVVDYAFKKFGYAREFSDRPIIGHITLATLFMNGNNKRVLPKSRKHSLGNGESENGSKWFN